MVGQINFRVDETDTNFTGRSEELKQLKAFLTCTEKKVVISGMGGVGKTQLTRRFIEQNRTHYENVVWIDAETENGINEAFKKLSEDKLHLSTINANGQHMDARSIIEQVLQKVCEKSTLFVYDNVDSIQSMMFVLAIAPPPRCEKPHVLITSRIQQWRQGINVILLNVFSREETVEFISEVLNNDRCDTAIDRNSLAEALQDFPLALRQATGFIKQQRRFGDYEIVHYIDKFTCKKGEMLKSEIFFNDLTSPYKRTTYTTWNITIDAIKADRKDGPLAIKVLNIIAYFEAEFIMRDWFLCHTFDDQLIDEEERQQRLKLAVDLLVKYCMVNSHEKQTLLEIHRLVQEVTKLKLDESHEEESVLIEALQLVSNIDVDNTVGYGRNTISVLKSALPYPDLVREFSSLALRILDEKLFFKSKKVKQFGETFLEPLNNILESNDRVLLKIRYYVARSYAEDEAYDMPEMNDIFEKQLENFGVGDRDTLQTLRQIAYMNLRLQNNDAAFKQYDDTLRLQKLYLGDTDPDTVQTGKDIALYKGIVQEASDLITQFMMRKGLI